MYPYTNQIPMHTMRPATILLSAALSVPQPASAFPGQDTFPVVERGTQEARDETRRQILETELTAEQHELDNAQRLIADATRTRQAADKLEELRAGAARHASNIEALHAELAGIGKLTSATRRQAPLRLPGRIKIDSPDQVLAIPFWDVYKRARPKAENASVSPPAANDTGGNPQSNRPEQ